MERNKERVPKIAPPVIATANALNNNNGSHVHQSSSVSMVRRQSTIGIERKSPLIIASPSTSSLSTTINNNCAPAAKKLKILPRKLSTNNSTLNHPSILSLTSSLHNNNIVTQKSPSASSRRKCQQPRRDANATVIITPTSTQSTPSIKVNKNLTQNINAKNFIALNGLLNPFLTSNNSYNKMSNISNIFASTSTNSSLLTATSTTSTTATASPTLLHGNTSTIAALFNILSKQNNNNNNKNSIFGQNGTNIAANCNNLAKLFAAHSNNSSLANGNSTNNNIRMGIETNNINNGNAFLMMQFIQNLVNGAAATTASSAKS